MFYIYYPVNGTSWKYALDCRSVSVETTVQFTASLRASIDPGTQYVLKSYHENEKKKKIP